MFNVIFLDVHNEIGTYTHSRPHRHFLVRPTGPFQWIEPYLFLVVSATTWCGVVASQSVAARGFPRVCVCVFFFSALFFLLFFSLCFCFLSFILQIPPISLSLSLVFLLLQAQVWLRYSTVCQSIAAPHSLPSETVCCSVPLSMSAAEHGRPRLLHYITVCMMLRGFTHAESEHLLPAHSGRVGPSAWTWMYSRNRLCSVSVHSFLVVILSSCLGLLNRACFLGSNCKTQTGSVFLPRND